jgi:hypothetical protein
MTPVLAALGAMAALIADFRVEIERDPDQVADTAAKLPHDAGDDAS